MNFEIFELVLPYVLLAIMLPIWRVHAVTKREQEMAAKGRVWAPTGFDHLLVSILKMVKAEAAGGVSALIGATVVTLMLPWLSREIMADVEVLQRGEALQFPPTGRVRLVMDGLGVLYRYISPQTALWALWIFFGGAIAGALMAAWRSFQNARTSSRTLYDECHQICMPKG